ncbi:ATP-dependent Clp protease ATP-binding subunit, partial [Candidatus Azambacteria bacterium]|nr:ATP-dependent Clp protease ATP-binding subunit [Candidatus Azambacteria bacterium]
MNKLPKIFEKFTLHAKNLLFTAMSEAKEKKSELIAPEHILSAILKEKGSLAYNLLAVNGIKAKIKKTKKTDLKLDEIIKPKLGHEAKEVLVKSITTASSYAHKYIGTEHILFAILEKTELLKNDQNYEKIRIQTDEILSSSVKFQNINELPQGILKGDFLSQTATTKEDKIPLAPKPKKNPEKFPALAFFCEDLNESAKSKNGTPVFGREKEIARISNILLRKLKNNPLLIGEAGVGKTAIVRGLSQKIVKKQVPAQLLDKKIFSLDMGLLVAGTTFRGEFEARLKDVLEDARSEEVILFIDEIHTIVGAGSASGSLDAANMLKPALSSGNIKVIAATTAEEYKKTIEKDQALARRFHPVKIQEESSEQAFHTISNLKESYEAHHNVKISEEAIASAIAYSEKYFPHRKLPDKALDLLDEAAAYAGNVKTASKDEQELIEVEKELNDLRSEKKMAVLNEDYKAGNELGKVEAFIEEEIKILKNNIQETEKSAAKITLTKEHIEKTLFEILNIKESEKDQKKKILNLRKSLGERVVGQEEAVKKVSEALMRAYANIRNKKRPLASFVFLGPSGTGKTELAKSIAKELFSEDAEYGKAFGNFIRIDMSEFS